jgi:hypothetical protein
LSKVAASRLFRILLMVVIVVVIGAIGFMLGAQKPMPLQVVTRYPLSFLAQEARTMNECADCHEAEDFHSCTTCHDDHGAIEFAEVPFYALIAFTGDVPEPGYVRIDEIMPYQNQPQTHISLLDFLAGQGVAEFESVTLVSGDGAFITLEPDALNEHALLLPYEDGIRFASEDLHVSTWAKGITRIVVAGKATPLTINGEPTSIGRLLLRPTRLVTVEQTEVMLASPLDGQVRRASTASRLEGVSIEEIVGPFEQIDVRDQTGNTHSLTADEALGALLVPMRDGVTLVLPGRGRSQWIEQVVSIETH